MERAGIIRTLAEPNLTAISGESANFLVGGEFPIPGNYTCDPTTHSCQVQVQFKKFGVGLNFTPVVMSGRPHQPQGHERGVGALERERADADAVDRRQLDPDLDHPVDQDPARRDDAGNPLRRLDRHGRPDPGADQAADQRHSRPDAAADPRHAVQEPRLRQSADRTGGDRDALCREARWRRRTSRAPTTASRTRAIPRPSCSAVSTASTASPPRAREPKRSYFGNYGFILD